MNQLPMNKRDFTLDMAKGILIILVVMGHSIQYSFGSSWLMSERFFDDTVFKAIYSFHMPLFMMISGYLFFNSNKKAFTTLMISKFKAIGIPMLSFVLLYNILQYLILLAKGEVMKIITHYISTIFQDITMWFLLSLLLNMTVVAVLTRVIKSKSLQYMVMFMLCVGSMWVPDNMLLSVHKFMFPFFCIGYVIKQSGINIYAMSNNKIGLGILSILSAIAIWWFDTDTYIYTSGFYIAGDDPHQVYTDCKRLTIALIVSYTMMQYIHRFVVSRQDTVTNRIVRLGQTSLFIYGLNIVFNLYYTKALALLHINFRFNYLIPVIVTIIFILVSDRLYKLMDKNKFTRMAFLGK